MFVSFLTVVVICIILVKEDEEYTSWLLDEVTSTNTNLVNIIQETKDADTLSQEIRVMCLVMTHPSNHKTKALKVEHNKEVFFNKSSNLMNISGVSNMG